jgi:peptide deformylase
MWADVKRSRSIKLEYIDEYGNFNVKESDGFMARLLQHEYDHLEGVLNIDIAEPGTIEVMNSDPFLEKLRDVD